MPASSERRRVRGIGVVSLIGVLLVMHSPAASARDQSVSERRGDRCPPASVGRPAVGEIAVGDTRVPVKPVPFRGSTLKPPPSALVAGLSLEHARLNSETGTTVLTWHVRYGKRCPGALNDLIRLPLGSTFDVTDEDGLTTEYRITDRTRVPKGRYPVAWFAQTGPRRLALFTCGRLRNGEFRSTVAIFAEPVSALVS